MVFDFGLFIIWL